MSCMEEMHKFLFLIAASGTFKPVITSTGSPLCVESFLCFFKELTSSLSV
jgi:hypothetical protein